jgi:hypothetical protein
MRMAMFGAMALAVMVTGQSSYAATIDFRNPIWTPNGANSTTVNGVTVTAQPGSARLSWASDDGFGIDSGRNDREHDEINNQEHLLVTFASPFTLTGVLFTDLFEEAHDGVTLAEIAEFRINGGEWEAISGLGNQPGTSNGEVFFNPSGMFDVTTLEFRADTFDPGGRRNDFSVALLEGSPTVPEPASLVLLGTGLGLAGIRRRRRPHPQAGTRGVSSPAAAPAPSDR